MDRIAQAGNRERAELFRSSSVSLQPALSPGIIEKDFWVCWVLHRIYEVLRFRPRMIFKGGTSLAKGYDIIQRFSEDIDLTLSRRDLGFVGNYDPKQSGISRKEAARRIKSLVKASRETINKKLLPALRADFSSVIGTDGWDIQTDEIDPQTLIFTYPRSEPKETLPEAVNPAIRLKMGARSDDRPVGKREIRPYAAEAFPEAFKITASCRVGVLDPKRTFWEKATLLHAEYHRPLAKSPSAGLARHYYDLFRMSRQRIGRQALARTDLLERVIANKRLFFTAAWAHYEKALTEEFRLLPHKNRGKFLRADYTRMREMIFGEIPPWEEILSALRELEKRINQCLCT
jgi:hypothetical protein